MMPAVMEPCGSRLQDRPSEADIFGLIFRLNLQPYAWDMLKFKHERSLFNSNDPHMYPKKNVP